MASCLWIGKDSQDGIPWHLVGLHVGPRDSATLLVVQPYTMLDDSGLDRILPWFIFHRGSID